MIMIITYSLQSGTTYRESIGNHLVIIKLIVLPDFKKYIFVRY